MSAGGDYHCRLVSQPYYGKHLLLLGPHTAERASMMLFDQWRISLGNRCLIWEGPRIELVTQFEGHT